MTKYWAEAKAEAFADNQSGQALNVALLGLGLLQTGSATEKRKRLADQLQGKYEAAQFEVGAADEQSRGRMLENFLAIKQSQIEADEMSKHYWTIERAQAHAQSLTPQELERALTRLELKPNGTGVEKQTRLAKRLSYEYVQTDNDAGRDHDEDTHMNLVDEYLDEIEEFESNAAGQDRDKTIKEVATTGTSAVPTTTPSTSTANSETRTYEITGPDGKRRVVNKATYDLLFADEQDSDILQAQIASLSLQSQIPAAIQPQPRTSGQRSVASTPRWPNTYTPEPWKTRDLSKIIPNWNLKFDGTEKEDVRDFFRKAEQMQKSAGLTKNDMVRGFHMLVENGAAAHYRRNESKWATYDEIRVNMIKEYSDELYTERKNDEVRARKQQQNESVREYIDALMILFDEMDEPVTDEKKKERIYKNILPDYMPLLRTQFHRSLHEFIEFATELGKAFQSGKRSREQAEKQSFIPSEACATTTVESDLRAELDTLKNQIAAMNTERYDSRRNHSGYRSHSGDRWHSRSRERWDRRNRNEYRNRERSKSPWYYKSSSRGDSRSRSKDSNGSKGSHRSRDETRNRDKYGKYERREYSRTRSNSRQHRDNDKHDDRDSGRHERNDRRNNDRRDNRDRNNKRNADRRDSRDKYRDDKNSKLDDRKNSGNGR
ncbi:uncharacterized protein LOC131675574 [Phymastichus coffea]|uniref:uncharacterized protein LOC131675574 n=1 Tax=Phymastichus coffea TaxID=108790 RepID=UPI00273B708C|nr:uncharacterized protein LOC131675574 [Phymastichus coffea]